MRRVVPYCTVSSDGADEEPDDAMQAQSSVSVLTGSQFLNSESRRGVVWLIFLFLTFTESNELVGQSISSLTEWLSDGITIIECRSSLRLI